MAQRPRASLFFTDGNFGWSETHYYVPATATLQPVLDEAVNLAKLRVQLLGSGVQLAHIRVSFDDTYRDSLGRAYPIASKNIGGVPYYNEGLIEAGQFMTDASACMPFYVTAVMLRMGEAYRKIAYEGGYPQSQQTFPVRDDYDAWFTQAYQAYHRYLVGQTAAGNPTTAGPLWGTVIRSKGADSPVSNLIAGAAPNAAGGMAYTTAIAHGLEQGDLVRIQGFRQDPNATQRFRLNGTFYVSSITDATHFIVNPTVTYTGVQITALGRYEQIVPLVKAYTSYEWRSQTHRKRGLPFGQPRGKSKKRPFRSV